MQTDLTGTSDQCVELLSRLAQEANFLAHQLTGTQRKMAFRIKAELLSTALILDGHDAITVNGLREGGIVGLDICGSGGNIRLHVPLQHLKPEARQLARKQSRFAPAKAPLSEMLASKCGVQEIGGTNEN